MLSNKKFSTSLNVPLFKARRWTKELLPPDPKATRRSGYTREFSLNQGFYVYLGGTMVEKFGWTFAQARAALDIIWPWLQQHGMVPEIPDGINMEGIDLEIRHFDALLFYTDRNTSLISGIEVLGSSQREISSDTDLMGREYTQTMFCEIRYFLFDLELVHS